MYLSTHHAILHASEVSQPIKHSALPLVLLTSTRSECGGKAIGVGVHIYVCVYVYNVCGLKNLIVH